MRGVRAPCIAGGSPGRTQGGDLQPTRARGAMRRTGYRAAATYRIDAGSRFTGHATAGIAECVILHTKRAGEPADRACPRWVENAGSDKGRSGSRSAHPGVKSGPRGTNTLMSRLSNVVASAIAWRVAATDSSAVATTSNRAVSRRSTPRPASASSTRISTSSDFFLFARARRNSAGCPGGFTQGTAVLGGRRRRGMASITVGCPFAGGFGSYGSARIVHAQVGESR
jgi:hypothetical protein